MDRHDPEEEEEEPRGDAAEEVCRFETDLAFLSEVGRRIAPLAARPGLAPEKARVIERAVAALRSLPELTPGINLQIEIAHRMGGEEFNESYSYLVKLHQRGLRSLPVEPSTTPRSGPTPSAWSRSNGTPMATPSRKVTGTPGSSGWRMRSRATTP